MWTEANVVWSLDGWPGYPENPLDETFGKLENTVNAQGDEKTPAPFLNPIWISDSSRRQWETTGVKFPKKICIRDFLIQITEASNW